MRTHDLHDEDLDRDAFLNLHANASDVGEGWNY